MKAHSRYRKQLVFNALLCMLLVVKSLSITAFAGTGEARGEAGGASQVVDRSRYARVAADNTDWIPELDPAENVSCDSWELLYETLEQIKTSKNQGDDTFVGSDGMLNCQIELAADLTYATSNYSVSPRLVIPSGCRVVLDLYGHTLDRGLGTSSSCDGSGGYVLMVEAGAELIIGDSSGEGTGTITGGYSDEVAGGIVNNGTLTINRVKISGNRCCEKGGGISNSGTLIINNCSISENVSENYSCGAGIFNTGTLTMTGTEVCNNEGYDGAGIFNGSEGIMNISGGTFSGNTTSGGSGAGIYNEGSTVIKDCVFSGNITGTGGSGGAIYSDQNQNVLTIEDSTFTGNTAQVGNAAYGFGGAICIYTGTLNLKDSTITNNQVTGASGRAGGIHVDENGVMNVEGSVVVRDNEAVDSALADDLAVEPDGVINVTGDLSEDSELCLYPLVKTSSNNIYDWRTLTDDSETRVLTSGLNALSGGSRGGSDNFTCETDGIVVGINGDGEAYIGKAAYTAQFASSVNDITVNNAEKSFPADSWYVLPECDYEGSDTYAFSCWEVGDQELQPGEAVQLTESLAENSVVTITAQFVDTSTVSTFQLQSVSMLSTGILGVNFFLQLPCPGLDGTETQDVKDAAVQQYYQNAAMAFSISSAGEAKDRITKSAGLDTDFKNSSTGEYYGFTCNITSIQMADTITAKFTYQDPFATNPEDSDASKTITKTYSIKQYLNSLDMSGNEYSEDAKTLIKAMADYGYYAQPYLAGVNGWTIDQEYARMGKRYTEEYDIDSILATIESDSAFETTYSDDGKEDHDIVQLDYTLKFDSGIDMVVFFTPSDSYTGNPVAQIDSESVDEVSDFDTGIVGKTTYYAELDDRRYVLVYSGLSAAKLKDSHKFELQTGSDADAYSFTATGLCFAKDLMESDSTDARNFGAALYYLYIAAAAVIS